MARRAALFFLVLGLVFLSACINNSPSFTTPLGPTVTLNPAPVASLTPFSPSTDTPFSSAAALPFPAASPTFTSRPASNSNTALPTYILDATLNYAAHSVSVDEVINYPNRTGQSLDNLVLAVEPNLWKNCFTLGGIMIYGQMVNDYHLFSDRLDLPLSTALAPNAAVNVLLHFDLSLPPADVYHLFGFNGSQTNLVDWYPFVVPYSNGWLLHPPANVGEHLVYDTANFDVTLRLVDSVSSVQIAAGAPAEGSNGTWHYHLSHARTFVLSTSPYYKLVSIPVNGISLTGYYFEAEKVQASAAIQAVAKALVTFTNLFGPITYSSLSMVESPFFDGMEYDGLFFLGRDYYKASDGTLLNNMIDIGVHETAHQWWFGSVGNDQALEPWLDEALATYSEKLFYEQNYPDVTAWQSFRVDAFDPSGWVDTDIYHGVNFRIYANAVYLQGASFLQALRDRIGDPAFLAFLKDYATQMAGKRSTSVEFFRILHEHTSANLSDILNKYFSHPPH